MSELTILRTDVAARGWRPGLWLTALLRWWRDPTRVAVAPMSSAWLREFDGSRRGDD